MTMLLAATLGRDAKSLSPRVSLAVLAALGTLVYGIGLESLAGYQTAIATGALRSPALAALQGDPEQASEITLARIYPHPAYVRTVLEELRKNGYWPLR